MKNSDTFIGKTGTQICQKCKKIIQTTWSSSGWHCENDPLEGYCTCDKIIDDETIQKSIDAFNKATAIAVVTCSQENEPVTTIQQYITIIQQENTKLRNEREELIRTLHYIYKLSQYNKDKIHNEASIILKKYLVIE